MQLCSKLSNQISLIDQSKNIAVADSDLVEIGEKRIKDMDKNGIDIAILSYSNPIQWVEGQESINLSVTANDFMFETVQKYPNRFFAFATLPWLDPIAASEEL